MKTQFLVVVWCAVLALVGAGRAADQARWHVFNHERVLGTSLEMKFAAASGAEAGAAEAAALAEIDRLGKILSGYDAASEFRVWAATKGEARRVSPELFEVLALFDTWRDRTGGALDASAEVAGRLWKTAALNQRVPSASELDAAVAAVRQTHWRLDPVARTATHLTDAPLMLNSFTKSFIIERACNVAMAVPHISGAVVNLGGDIVMRGAAVETVAIVDPLADGENDGPLVEIVTRDRAVATSGGYRRGVEIAGRWYSHLVDPRTGRPVDHVRSATVVARRATDAGALATALCVMATDKGRALAATVPDAEYCLVLNDGRRVVSAGWTALEQPRVAEASGGIHAAVAAGNPTSGVKATTWDPAFELAVNLEIASPNGGRAKRPFLAVWIEDKDGFPVRTLALWYHGDRWLPDMRAWYHADNVRSMAEGTQIVASVSSATRGPGKYTVKWDGKDAGGRAVAQGKYTVAIEVSREHGTHQLIRQELDFSGVEMKVDLAANIELGPGSLIYRRKTAAR